jgi:hypothetical protein
MSAAFENACVVRIALAAIVAGPEHGPSALSAAPILSNLLSDYLPYSPRETGSLIAAAQAEAAGMLRDHVRRGMDAATAIRITASALAAQTAYSSEACLWAAGELALALGLTTPDNETVSAAAAVGRVSAELIAPYPPGVPVLAPGELIVSAAIDSLREVKADGGRIAYAADPSLETFQVVVRN